MAILNRLLIIVNLLSWNQILNGFLNKIANVYLALRLPASTPSVSGLAAQGRLPWMFDLSISNTDYSGSPAFCRATTIRSISALSL
jgi:hypothetical protein